MYSDIYPHAYIRARTHTHTYTYRKTHAYTNDIYLRIAWRATAVPFSIYRSITASVRDQSGVHSRDDESACSSSLLSLLEISRTWNSFSYLCVRDDEGRIPWRTHYIPVISYSLYAHSVFLYVSWWPSSARKLPVNTTCTIRLRVVRWYRSPPHARPSDSLGLSLMWKKRMNCVHFDFLRMINFRILDRWT